MTEASESGRKHVRMTKAEIEAKRATQPVPPAVASELAAEFGKDPSPAAGARPTPSPIAAVPIDTVRTAGLISTAEILTPVPAAPSELPPPTGSALLDGDPLAPVRFQTKTRKLLSKRLERGTAQRATERFLRGPAVVVDSLDASYEGKQVLFSLSFKVMQGEILAILGGSGSGKTTLLKHLIGLLRPAKGKVEIGGKDIASLEGDDLALVLKSVGMLFQYSALFNSMTIGENVALPLREYTDLPEHSIEAIVRLKLALVGLPGIEGLLPNQLSGGMKKRAALARALALDPDVLFFDEPASGLDPIAAAELDSLILHLNKSFGTTMVIVTHDLENAFNVAHRILMLDRGRIAALGTPGEIKRSENTWVRSFLQRASSSRDAVDEAFFARLENSTVKATGVEVPVPQPPPDPAAGKKAP